MIVIFSKEEQKYIETKKSGWTIKENCPEEIRINLQKKLLFMEQKDREVKDNGQKQRNGNK